MVVNSMSAVLQPSTIRMLGFNEAHYNSKTLLHRSDNSRPLVSLARTRNTTSRLQLSSTAVSSRHRRRQSPPEEADQVQEEPQVDVTRKVDAISSQLQLAPNHVRSLVQQHRALAELPVDKLVRQLPVVAHVLSIPLHQALHMAAQHPAVLDSDPQQLVDSCSKLAAAVKLPVEQAMYLVARQPSLLKHPPSRLIVEAAKLEAALGCSQAGALQLLSRLTARELQSVLSMSSSTVLQRLPEVVEALGLPTESTRGINLFALVSKNPSLLASSLNDIGRSTDALLVAFQSGTPGTLAAVLAKCPHLLTHPAEKLLATYQALLVQLQVSRQTAARMLVKHPQLLRSNPESISQKLRVMAFKLYLPQAQVVSMCVRQPALLSCDSDKLQQRLQHLQHLLGTSYEAAVKAVARTPQLLLLTTERVDHQFSILQQQSGLPRAKLGSLLLQEPALLSLSETHVQHTFQVMHEVLQLQAGSHDLSRVLLDSPRVVLRGHKVLLEQLTELQEYLVLPVSAVAGLVRRSPGILAANRSTWLANISTLLQVLDLLPVQVQAAIEAQPKLLMLKPHDLLQRAAKTVYVVRQCAGWAPQLQQLRTPEVCRLLGLSDGALLRLTYLHRTGRHGELGQDIALVWRRSVFCSEHPAFSSWLKQQQQQQQPLLPTAAAAVAAATAVLAAAQGPLPQTSSEGTRTAAAVQELPSKGGMLQQRRIDSGQQGSSAEQQQQQQQQQKTQRLTWMQQLQPQPRPVWQPAKEQDDDQQQQQQQQQASQQQDKVRPAGPSATFSEEEALASTEDRLQPAAEVAGLPR